VCFSVCVLCVCVPLSQCVSLSVCVCFSLYVYVGKSPPVCQFSSTLSLTLP